MIIPDRDEKKGLILGILRKKEQVFRYEIAQMTNISPAGVGILINELTKEGLVVEAGKGKTYRGRKPVLLELNAGYKYVVGVDFDAVEIHIVLADIKGNKSESAKYEISPGEENLSIIRKIITGIKDILKKGKVSPDRLIGIGVGVPGQIDKANGVGVFYSRLPGWINVPVRDLLKMEFNTSVIIDNNVKTITLGEKWFGQGRGFSDYLCVAVRSGISSGIVIGDKLYRGFKDSAGEIGHISVRKGNHHCPCGNKGCLELFASNQGMVSQYKKGTGKEPGIDELIDMGLSGDNDALEVIQRAGKYIGSVFAAVINMFNPEAIIISGKIEKVKDIVQKEIESAINRKVIKRLRGTTKVVFSTLGDDVGALGATMLVVEEIFKF